MKTNIYKIRNNIDRVLNKKNTLFLDAREFKDVTSKLKKSEYNIYYPNKSSEKVILYYDKEPLVSLIKIKSYNELKHNQILGSLMNLNIDSGYIGDIIIDNNNYYFYILSEMKDYVIQNLIYIGNNYVELEEIDIKTLVNYERNYETIKILCSSLRIDSVISRIINSSREVACDKIKEKDVIINYEVASKSSYVLK